MQCRTLIERKWRKLLCGLLTEPRNPPTVVLLTSNEFSSLVLSINTRQWLTDTLFQVSKFLRSVDFVEKTKKRLLQTHPKSHDGKVIPMSLPSYFYDFRLLLRFPC